MMTDALGALILAWLSTWHVIVVLLVVLILFGGRKLPELARGLGRGLRIFKDEVKGIQKDIEEPAKMDQPGPHDDLVAKPQEPAEKK